jgi:hypothetical protein
LLRPPSSPERSLDIAVPAMPGLGPLSLAPIKADQLPYVIGLPIIDAPLPTIPFDAGSKRTPGFR